MIPGSVIAFLTFPGVIVHEMAHQLMCRLFGLPVYSVCYFRRGNPAGYVIHEPSTSYRQEFWVAVGPMVINTLFAMIIGFPVGISFSVTGNPPALHWVLAWLAVSIGMHAFPSNQDGANLWAKSKEARASGSIAALFGFPVVLFIRIANFLSVAWFDTVYAIAAVALLPNLIVYFLARM